MRLDRISLRRYSTPRGFLEDIQSFSFVLAIGLAIGSGQFFDEVLHSQVLRGIAIAGAVFLTMKRGSTGILIVCLGYLVPLILGLPNTLLPQTYYFYFISLAFAVLVRLVFNRHGGAGAVRSIDSKLIITYIIFLVVTIQGEFFSVKYETDVNIYLSYSLGLLCVFLICRKDDENKILYAFVAISAFLSSWTIFGPSEYSVLSARYEVGYDQNYYSLLVGIGVLTVVGFMLSSVGPRKHLLSYVLSATVIIDLFALFRLGSRGVFVALVVAVATMIYIAKLNKRQLVLVFSTLFLIMAVFIQYSLSDIIVSRFQETHTVVTLGRRIPLAVNAIYHILDAPISEKLFGAGTNSRTKVLVGVIFDTPTSPHNQFLDFALDYGLVGLLLFVMLLSYGFRNSINSEITYKTTRVGLLVFLSVCCLSLTPFKTSILPWVVFGLTLTSEKAGTIDSRVNKGVVAVKGQAVSSPPA